MDTFSLLGNDVGQWRSFAEALAYNAEILTQHRHQHREERDQYPKTSGAWGKAHMYFASLVLWGYALECFFKCLHLKQGKLLVENDRFIGRTNHNLVMMADDLGFPLSRPQRRVLKSLSVIALWGGRYPIATTAEKSICSFYWGEPEDDETVETLVKALRLQIDSQ